MWVAKTPQRPDFCGCPPCPLCFNWVDGEKTTLGMEKFMDDILGVRVRTSTEVETLEKAAEAIHAANLTRDERIAEELREADHAQHFQRQMGEALQLAKSQAARPKPLNTVVLDGRDFSSIEKEQIKKDKEKRVAKTRELMATNSIGNSPLRPYEDSSLFYNEMRRMRDYQEEQMRQVMYYGPTFGIDFGTPVINNTSNQPPKLSDKERREAQAKEDAKTRMKVAAREPVRR